MKICSNCKTSKLLTDFNWKITNKIKQSMCRVCFKIYRKKIYHNDGGKSKESKRLYSSNKRKENRRFVLKYLKNNSCVDCNEDDPIVLEFDHLRDKKAPISHMICHSGIKQIIEEIAKCEVRCANCHRRKTAKDQEWYKFID